MVRETPPKMAEACSRCSTEFLLGARFCHTCGAKRPDGLSPAAHADAAAIARLWQKVVDGSVSLFSRIPWSSLSGKRFQVPAWLSYVQFQRMKGLLGLSTGALISFGVGIGCIAGALLVGLLTANNLVEWQAIQFYRAEWLLAATAAFVAGILLKKPSRD